MKKRIYLGLLWLFYIFIWGQKTPDKAKIYIQQYAETAIQEMEKFDIPASITLAQGMIESAFGESWLAKEGNNHFGIKCPNDWTGEKIYHDDDTKQECFRKYTTAWWSFRDHSKFLQKSRYASLYKLEKTDYKAWAYGLKEAGYATNPNYPNLLINKIETYKLYQFDLQTSASFKTFFENYLAKIFPENKTNLGHSVTLEENTPAITNGKTATVLYHPNGNIPYVIAQKGDTWIALAQLYKLQLNTILKYNDVAVSKKLLTGQYIFLKAKKNKGLVPFHIVKKNENLYMIAQHYAIKLKKLQQKNAMTPKTILIEGQKITLQKSLFK